MTGATSVPGERLVLLGFMGAGKSTVGPMVAAAIGWAFVDLDEEVERQTGMAVPEIIRQRGERHFRELEAEVGRRVLQERRIVVAVGGGWAAQPGQMQLLEGVARSVWLDVSPETAVARVVGSKTARPLLETDDPVKTASTLLNERRPYFVRADVRIDTECRSAQEVARAVVDCAMANLAGTQAQVGGTGCEVSTNA